jgi:hypothetical protein
LHAAHAAGDRALGAYLVMCLAYQAVRLGEPRDAPRLARIAVEGAREVPSARARALLHGHLLVIRAATGNRPVPPARHDPSPGEDDPAWSRWFTPAVSPFGLAHRPFVDAVGPPLRGRWEPDPGPLPGSSQRRLHELAELMAIAGPDVVREVRAEVDGLLA